MNTMKAIQVKAPKEPMELVEIPIPEPNDEQVLLKVEACGVCRGDSKVIEGWASRYPRIPGHEIIGTVQKLGSKVTKWKIGDRVGSVSYTHLDVYKRQALIQPSQKL